MPRFLGLGLAALVAAAFTALSGDPALALHVRCGDAISQNTTLDSDLVGCSSPALTITGPDVILNLGGHRVEGGIRGDGTRQIDENTFGSSPRAVIENGTVWGGVSLRVYANMTVQRLRTDGISAERGGKLIQNNVLDGGGIGCDRGGGLIQNNVIRNGYVSLSFGCSAVVSQNLVDHGSIEALVARATVVGNTIRHSREHAIRVQIAGITATGNVVTDSGGDGVHMTGTRTSTLRENRITRSTGDGISIADPDGEVDVRLEGNRVDRSGDDGIDVDFPATFTGNRVWLNGDLGIEAPLGSSGSNWAKHNGNPAQCVPAHLCSSEGKP